MNINENVVVTTKDWLKATEGMRITAYDPAPTKLTSADSATTVFTKADFENAIRNVSQTTRPSMPEEEKK